MGAGLPLSEGEAPPAAVGDADGVTAGAVPGLAQAVAEISSSPASPAAIQSTAPGLAVRRVLAAR